LRARFALEAIPQLTPLKSLLGTAWLRRATARAILDEAEDLAGGTVFPEQQTLFASLFGAGVALLLMTLFLLYQKWRYAAVMS
jgi:hypothetical protein